MMDFDKNNVDEIQEETVIINNNSNTEINSATPKSSFRKVIDNLLANKYSTIFLGIMIVLVIAIILLSIFSNDNVSYCGTWDIHSVNIEGSVYTISELETMGDYSLSDFRIVIKEGGKAWIHSQGSGTTFDWENTKDGIIIGVRECSFENKLLSIDNNGIIIYLSKTSDSQTVSKPEADNTHTHTGGVATCTEKAICGVCNEQYGELNSANHSSTDYNYSVNANDNTKHDKKYSCCGIVVSTVAHSGGIATTTQKAKCEYCNASYGNVLSNNTHTHTGGVATCTEKAICSICNEQYGQFNSTNHSSATFSYIVNSTDNTKHDKKYACCGVVVATVEHSGGTATTTQKAKCEYCNTSYGNVLSSFNWQLAGNGCGARIPEPSFGYDVKASSTYLCVEVYNTTEEDFYDYVDECRAYGFNGTVGSATSPDLYYMVYDADEYYLEVFYYADDEYIYVYVRPPYDDSEDNNENNNQDQNNTESDSQGLEYTLSNDSTYYIISDIGNCTATSITIPSEYKGIPVKVIGGYAFYDCDEIETIIFPDSLIEIEKGAFYDCNGIETIVIPNSVKVIGEDAFGHCDSITNLQIGENVQTIGRGAFSSCESIEYVDIPNSVSIINEYAFSNCYSLKNIHIGNNVITIGKGAFYWCSSLEGFTIPASVEYIGYEAFYYCESVRTVTIYKGVEVIDDYAFCFFGYPVDFYYTGNEDEWNQVSINEDAGNFYLTAWNVYYNYVPE